MDYLAAATVASTLPAENTLPKEPAVPSRPGGCLPSETTLEWIERQNILLETANADEILSWAVETFSPALRWPPALDRKAA